MAASVKGIAAKAIVKTSSGTFKFGEETRGGIK